MGEGAQRIIKEDKRNELLKVAAKIFLDADMDCNCYLTREEFEELVDDHMLDDFFRLLGVGNNDAKKLFSIFDDDESGDLSLVEFVGGCLHLGSTARAMDLAAVRFGQKAHGNEMRRSMNRLERGMWNLEHNFREVVDG